MKFYKIVNTKGHNGLVYHEGINTDPKPFRPSGTCEGGGIYFSREDILAFLHYGTELYEVEPIGEVYEDPKKSPKKWKAHSIKLTYVGKVKDNIQFLAEQGANIHADYDLPLRWAALNGYFEVVKYLVEQGADVHTDDDRPLQYAVENGHLDVIKYLVEQGADIHVNNDCPLRFAVLNNHLGVVKYLVEQGVDIRTQGNYALQWATQRGYLDIVKYLESKM